MHTDTKVLPIPSSSCFMAPALASPDLCIEFGAKIRSLPTLRPGSQVSANHALPVRAATDIASQVEWLKPLSITETAAVKRHCTSYATASA